tara:strand:+ start:660 stop:947 length:288 start_codon:yes stop_codon:yes gene_type:complete
MPRYKMVGNNRIELTAEELAELNARETEWSNNAFNRSIENLRQKRNGLLQETDWWGASDNTMSAEQIQYRQELRDLTNGLTTVADVEAVVFPTKP